MQNSLHSPHSYHWSLYYSVFLSSIEFSLKVNCLFKEKKKITKSSYLSDCLHKQDLPYSASSSHCTSQLAVHKVPRPATASHCAPPHTPNLFFLPPLLRLFGWFPPIPTPWQGLEGSIKNISSLRLLLLINTTEHDHLTVPSSKGLQNCEMVFLMKKEMDS